MKLYFKILKFITPYWKSISVAILLTIIYVLFNNLSLWVVVNFVNEIFSPEYLDGITNAVQAQKEIVTTKGHITLYKTINNFIKSIIIQKDKESTLIAVCIVILFSYLIKNISIYIKRVLINHTVLNIIVKFRNSLHNKMLRLPLSYLNKKHSGELTSLVFNDVSSIRHVLQDTFGNMILSPIQVLSNIVLMFIISVELSLITLIVVPISTLIIVKIGQSMRRKSRRVLQQISNVMSTFQEAITSIKIIKAFTTEKSEIKKFSDTNREWFNRNHRANRLKYLSSPLNEVIMVFMLVFLLWYGGNLVYRNAGLNAEDFLRFLIFLFTMFAPIKELAGLNNILQTGVAAGERIFKVLEIEEEPYETAESVSIKSFDKSIEYKNVSFRYSKNGPMVLKDVSFEVHKGEMVAFVGHSGSGKTTLVNLLPRFYQAEQGNIYIDEQDTRQITLYSLRNQMSIVTQDTILFSDTIRMNISYGSHSATETDIIEAAKIANAWEFIEKFDLGLDTHIGEKGTRLSGGQKQRLSIARAILKNPPILILDEATSALDTESERLVQEAIDNLLKSRTVFVIAHRLSTIKNADKIIVLTDGQIEAVGKHQELLKKSITYETLCKNQFIEA